MNGNVFEYVIGDVVSPWVEWAQVPQSFGHMKDKCTTLIMFYEQRSAKEDRLRHFIISRVFLRGCLFFQPNPVT